MVMFVFLNSDLVNLSLHHSVLKKAKHHHSASELYSGERFLMRQTIITMRSLMQGLITNGTVKCLTNPLGGVYTFLQDMTYCLAPEGGNREIVSKF